MGVVTVDAGDLPLRDGVVRGQGERRGDVAVAGGAERGDLGTLHFLRRPLVDLVAVRAAQVRDGVRAARPVREIGEGLAGVTLEADERQGARRNLLEGDEGLVVAGVVGDGRDREAPRPVAGLAIHEGQVRLRRDLLAVDADAEVPGERVVRVALGGAGGGADVIRVEATGDELLVLLDRPARPAVLEGGAADDRDGQGAEERNGPSSPTHPHTHLLSTVCVSPARCIRRWAGKHAA